MALPLPRGPWFEQTRVGPITIRRAPPLITEETLTPSPVGAPPTLLRTPSPAAPSVVIPPSPSDMIVRKFLPSDLPTEKEKEEALLFGTPSTKRIIADYSPAMAGQLRDGNFVQYVSTLRAFGGQAVWRLRFQNPFKDQPIQVPELTAKGDVPDVGVPGQGRGVGQETAFIQDVETFIQYGDWLETVIHGKDIQAVVNDQVHHDYSVYIVTVPILRIDGVVVNPAHIYGAWHVHELEVDVHFRLEDVDIREDTIIAKYLRHVPIVSYITETSTQIVGDHVAANASQGSNVTASGNETREDNVLHVTFKMDSMRMHASTKGNGNGKAKAKKK